MEFHLNCYSFHEQWRRTFFTDEHSGNAMERLFDCEIICSGDTYMGILYKKLVAWIAFKDKYENSS